MLRDRADRLDLPAASCSSRPVFPAPLGGWRDPSNTQADLRDAFVAAGFDWVTSHVFRKTVATLMDQAGLSSRRGRPTRPCQHVDDHRRLLRPQGRRHRRRRRPGDPRNVRRRRPPHPPRPAHHTMTAGIARLAAGVLIIEVGAH